MMACAKAVTVISKCFPFTRVALKIRDLFNSKSKMQKGYWIGAITTRYIFQMKMYCCLVPSVF